MEALDVVDRQVELMLHRPLAGALGAHCVPMFLYLFVARAVVF
jgi:hypothetical protein